MPMVEIELDPPRQRLIQGFVQYTPGIGRVPPRPTEERLRWLVEMERDLPRNSKALRGGAAAPTCFWLGVFYLGQGACC